MSSEPSRDELMSRIDRLEKLVMSAMSNQPQPELPPCGKFQFDVMPNCNPHVVPPPESTNGSQKSENDHGVDQLSKAFGVMKVDPSQVVYLGGAHWVSIMSEVIVQGTKQ